MGWKYNPFTETLDRVGEQNYRGALATAPGSPQNGWMYLNTTNNRMYVYHSSTWQALHELIVTGLSYLLLETGDKLLLETGDKLALE